MQQFECKTENIFNETLGMNEGIQILVNYFDIYEQYFELCFLIIYVIILTRLQWHDFRFNFIERAQIHNIHHVKVLNIVTDRLHELLTIENLTIQSCLWILSEQWWERTYVYEYIQSIFSKTIIIGEKIYICSYS